MPGVCLDLWSNQLCQWLEEGCHQPVLGSLCSNPSSNAEPPQQVWNRVGAATARLGQLANKTSLCLALPIMTAGNRCAWHRAQMAMARLLSSGRLQGWGQRSSTDPRRQTRETSNLRMLLYRLSGCLTDRPGKQPMQPTA